MKTKIRTKPVIEITDPSFAIPVTIEQLKALGLTGEDIEKGEKRLESKGSGMWGIVTSLRGIVEDAEYIRLGEQVKCKWKRFYAPRRCHKIKESGYHLEGRISLGGLERHVFTSSQMFELPDGRLIHVATLHTCKR